MQENLRKCIRCDGRKKMYKINGIYNHTNTGGVLVDCPLCLGKGNIPVLPDVGPVNITLELKGFTEVPADSTLIIHDDGRREIKPNQSNGTKKEFKEGSKNAKKEKSRTRKT